MEFAIGIVVIPNEYVIGLAGLKIWDVEGNVTAAVYGLFIGSYGLGFMINYDT